MIQISRKYSGAVTRREFMTKAGLVFAGLVATMQTTRNMSGNFLVTGRSGSTSPDSIFQPKVGSRIGYWWNKVSGFRSR